MIVGVDIGNTHLKWQIYGESTVCRGDSVKEMHQALSSSQVKRIVCCSVRGAAFDARFHADVIRYFGFEPEFCFSEPSFGFVHCAYGDNYARLGADRWMAILAAAALRKKCVAIVDIGTAITIDIVDQQRGHLGGYIVPGFNTLVGSINSGTKLIDIKPDYDAGFHALGLVTSECVNIGCTNMVVAFIDSVLDRFPAAEPLFCGGGYEMIKNHLRNKGLYKNTLVFDGLFERTIEHSLKI